MPIRTGDDNPLRGENQTPAIRDGRFLGGQISAKARHAEAEQRRAQFVRLLTEGYSPEDACDEIGVVKRTYENWRGKFPMFASACDAARGVTRRFAPADEHIRDDFLAWRKHYLGSDTTWFQAKIAEALQDDSIGGGTITLVLFPPEHGKTTLIEDFITWRLAVDKSYRVTYGSESQAHSRKALRRVRNRLEVDGPFPALVAEFGPFAPPRRTVDHRGAQPWGQDFFDVAGRTKSDERDYSMVALGFGSQIAGSRTDLLVGDDLISMRNVNQSDKLLQTFRQDWLSRPGTKGRTVIIGTRVADGDLYDLIEQEDLADHIVRIKAHDPNRIHLFDTPWLWPERYSEDEYTKMRKNVGESAWARNYQQSPRLAGDSTFTDTMLEKASSPLRSVLSPPPLGAQGMVIGLDPGFGKNAILVVAGNAERMWVLGGRVDSGLTNNQQIFSTVETAANEHSQRKLPWLHLAIEDKAFQKGLLDDAALHELQKQHGFTVGGHQTGINKYDENIGVPAMARDFLRGVIDLPGADDPETIRFRTMLDDELVRWRPFKKGTELKQDMVMALWFAWLWWSKFRSGLSTRTNNPGIQAPGLPWKPTVLPGGMTRVR